MCFVEKILDTVMQYARTGFLCILAIQYTIARVYYFSITLKVKRLVYFLFSSINSSHLLSHLFP